MLTTSIHSMVVAAQVTTAMEKHTNKKGTQIGKEEAKLPPFTDGMIIFRKPQ